VAELKNRLVHTVCYVRNLYHVSFKVIYLYIRLCSIHINLLYTDGIILFIVCSGAMKCLLNGVLEQRDTVCMNLYKRAFPKRPNHLFPLCSASDSLPCMEDQNAV